ncbi:coiled-coil domain-containing protein [Mycoplasma sp. VS31B]
MKNKFKKLPLFLGAFGALSALPLSAISCMYNDNPTVVYAQKFIDNNGFIVKDRIASTKKPNLVQFENDLFNSKFLTYTFTNFYLEPQSIVKVNNKNYEVTVDNLYSADNKNNQLIIQESKINKLPSEDVKNDIKEKITKLNASLAEYFEKIAKNDSDVENIPSGFRTLQGLIDATYMPRATFTALKFIVYDENGQPVKFFNEEKQKWEDKVDNDAKRLVSVLVNDLKNVFSYTWLDTVHYKDQIVTEQDVKEVVENFLKNTPYYSAYIDNMNDPKDKKGDNHVLKWDEPTHSAVFNFQQIIKYYNAIPTENMQSFQKAFFGSLDNLAFGEVSKNPIKYFKDIFKQMSTRFNNYAVNVGALPVNGISLGFAPENLIYGVNPSSGQSSDKFTVFNPVVDDKNNPITDKTILTQQEQINFLSNPYLYFWTHTYQLFFETRNKAYNNLLSAKETLRDVLDGKVIETTEAEAREEVQTYEDEIREFDTLINDIKTKSQPAIELFNKIQKINNNAEKTDDDIKKLETYTQQLNEQITLLKGNDDIKSSQITGGFLDNDLIKSDIAAVFEILYKNVSESVTTVYSLASLYAQALFANGLYNVQIIKGTNQNLSQDISNLITNKKEELKALEQKHDTSAIEKIKAEINNLESYAANSFYWIEFKAGNQAYMFDVFKSYLSYQSNTSFPTFMGQSAKEAYNIDNAFETQLPSGYVVDDLYKNVTYFK